MKSLPETKFWKAVSSRLDQYSEDPFPDDWDKIRVALDSRPSRSIAMNRTSDVLVLILLGFMLGFQVARFSGQTSSATITSVQNEIIDQDAKSSLHEPSKNAGAQNITSYKSRSERGKELASTEATAGFEEMSEKQIQPSPSAADKRTSQQISKNIGDEQNTRKANNGETNRNGITQGDAPSDLNSKSNFHVDSYATLASNSAEASAIDTTLTESFVSAEHNASSTRTTNELGKIDENKLIKSDSASGVDKRNKPAVVNSIEKPEQKKSKIRKFHPQLFLQLNPLMAYNKIIPVKNDQITIEKLNSPGIISANRFALGTEIGLQIPVARSFEVYAALGYHVQQTSISYDYISGEMVNVNATDKPMSFNIAPLTETRNYSFEMRHKSFSAGALYTLKGTRLQHKIGGGIFYMVGNQASNDSDAQRVQTKLFGYQLHYRLEYRVNTRLGIYVQPTFKHSLSTVQHSENPFASKPYWGGIGFGLTFRF